MYTFPYHVSECLHACLLAQNKILEIIESDCKVVICKVWRKMILNRNRYHRLIDLLVGRWFIEPINKWYMSRFLACIPNPMPWCDKWQVNESSWLCFSFHHQDHNSNFSCCQCRSKQESHHVFLLSWPILSQL